MAFPFDAPALTRRNTAARKCGRSQRRHFHNRALAGAMARRSSYQITNSLLFRGGQYLSRTMGTPTSAQKVIISVWVRRGALGTVQDIIGSSVGAVLRFGTSTSGTVGGSGTDQITLCGNSGGAYVCTTSAVFRDPTAWLHIFAVLDSTASAGNRIKLWVNGAPQSWASYAEPASGASFQAVASGATLYLGSYDGANNFFSGAMAEPRIVDGSTPAVTAFGETDPVTGNRCPKVVSGVTWGNNGVCLGNPWNSASLGTDYSGQGNHWTPNGFATTDVLSDSPTNVYATINPLAIWNGKSSSQPTISNGNLSFSGSGGWWGEMYGSLPVSSGKWYWEVSYQTAPPGSVLGIGVRTSASVATATDAGTVNNVWFYRADGQQSKNGVVSALGGAITNGCVMGLAFDADAGTLAVYKDNVLQGTITGIPAGTYATLAHSYNAVGSYKFGQGGFTYTPPTGFKALCSANMPATTGATSGSFTGNASVDGPCVYTGAVPQSLTINGNAVTWGTHADKLATGFKLRTSSASYNTAGTNNWTATYSGKPTVGSNKVPANAQGNP